MNHCDAKIYGIYEAWHSQGCQRKPATDLPASDLHGFPKVNRTFRAPYQPGHPETRWARQTGSACATTTSSRRSGSGATAGPA